MSYATSERRAKGRPADGRYGRRPGAPASPAGGGKLVNFVKVSEKAHPFPEVCQSSETAPRFFEIWQSSENIALAPSSSALTTIQDNIKS